MVAMVQQDETKRNKNFRAEVFSGEEIDQPFLGTSSFFVLFWGESSTHSLDPFEKASRNPQKTTFSPERGELKGDVYDFQFISHPLFTFLQSAQNMRTKAQKLKSLVCPFCQTKIHLSNFHCNLAHLHPRNSQVALLLM